VTLTDRDFTDTPQLDQEDNLPANLSLANLVHLMHQWTDEAAVTMLT